MIMLLMNTILISANNLCLNNTLSDTNLCIRHLNISRREMPQIVGHHKDRFMDYLFNNKELKSWCAILNPTLLTSTQKEIHEGLVTSMIIDLMNNGQMEPIFISVDGHILDGHHRWAALESLKIEIKVIVIDLPISNLLQLSTHFSEKGHV